MLMSEQIKQKAREFGADICGIGDIALYADAPLQRDPKAILPEAKCVIGCGFRVPRGLHKTMQRGRQFFNYTQMGVKIMDEELAEIFLLKMAAFIEDRGYDACLQRNVSNLRIKGDKTTNPELVDTYELVHSEPVGSGKPAPDVILDFEESAKICGLGCASVKGNILTPQFGPFVRFVYIVTDAPLEPDAPFEKNLCDRCGACASVCPGSAISMEAGLDTWQCAVYYRGAHKTNPYITDAFLRGDPRREDILEGRYRFTSQTARELYPQMDFLPSRATGYIPCLCGKICDIACYNYLKEKGLIP